MNEDIKPPEDKGPIDDKKIMKDFESIEPVPSTETSQPTEDIKPVEEVKNPKTGKKKILKILLFILLILVIAALSASAAYYWRDNTAKDAKTKQDAEISALQKEKTSLKQQLADAKDATAAGDETTCTPTTPSATVISNIKASITSGNTAALGGYMAASVNVILAATEGIGPSTPAAAVSSVTNFIDFSTDASHSWNFSLPAATLAAYRAGGYSTYFPSDAVIGKSADGKVISFSFDCDAKIKKVFMAGSSELL